MYLNLDYAHKQNGLHFTLHFVTLLCMCHANAVTILNLQSQGAAFIKGLGYLLSYWSQLPKSGCGYASITDEVSNTELTVY